MNSLLSKKLEELHRCLLEEPCIKEYLFYKELVSKQEVLIELEKDVQFLQKQWMKNRYLDQEDEILNSLYQEKKRSIEENPLLQNYLLAKEEVYHYLEHLNLYITSRL